MKQLLLAFFCIAILLGKAQNGFTTYTSNISITGLAKWKTALLNDNAGNKWIGFRTISAGSQQGNAGLVKYEKATGNWTLYNQTSIPAFPSNRVTSLEEDSNGNIWIGCDSGLVKFDGLTFTKYNTSNGLPHNFVNCVDAIGSKVYVGTNKGLSCFDGTTFTNYSTLNATLPNDTITSIKAENQNLVWLGCGVNRLVRFNNNGTSTSYVNYPISGNPGKFNCIYIDGQNTKWIGTGNKGLFKFDGAQFINAENLYSLPGDIPDFVSDIAKGLHNGIVVKYKFYNYVSPDTYGLVELTSNGEFYVYLKSSTTFTTDVFGSIEGDGNEIYYTMSQGPLQSNSQFPNMFGSFNDSVYVPPIGTINHVNYKTLDINQVSATIGSWGSMHGFRFEDFGYQVPKNSGNHTIGNTSLWIGGLNQSNQLCGAAQYEDSRDFWPGPIDTVNVSTDSMTSNSYNKLWKVSNTEINDFILNFNNGNVQNGTYTIPGDMLTWPAHGQGNYSRNLAPFIDHNGDGLYNSYDGDYPEIKGDQTVYSIYNDLLAPHTSTFTPMGLEVHLMAYAYGCPSVLNGRNELAYTTFYNYKIVNRSLNNYHDVFLGLYSQEGSYKNYVGCNVGENYSYLYGDPFYSSINVIVPAQGVMILRGPLAQQSDGIDNDNDGIIDESNEECRLTSFSECIHLDMPDEKINSPYYADGYYNRLKGNWTDGTPIICWYDWVNNSNETKWAYSGDPTINGLNTDPTNACGYWIYNGIGSYGNGINGSGPFNFEAGEVKEIEYAFVTSIDSSLTNNTNLLSVAKLKTDIQKVKAFYEMQNKPSCSPTIMDVTEALEQTDFSIYPNPSRAIVNVVSSIEGTVKINYELFDVLGKTVLKNESRNNSFAVNIESLNSGIYFLKLNVNGSMVVKKIIKE